MIPFSWRPSLVWRMGHGRMASTLSTGVGGERCLPRGNGFKNTLKFENTFENSLSNSFIIGIYPVASERWRVLMPAPFKIIWYTNCEWIQSVVVATSMVKTIGKIYIETFCSVFTTIENGTPTRSWSALALLISGFFFSMVVQLAQLLFNECIFD